MSVTSHVVKLTSSITTARFSKALFVDSHNLLLTILLDVIKSIGVIKENKDNGTLTTIN